MATILRILLEKKMYAKFNKCEFWLEKIAFMGHIVFKDSISMDLANVEAIMNSKRLTTIIEIRSFLGMISY